MTLKQLRREYNIWRGKAAGRRASLRFARTKSKLPWSKRKVNIERYARLVRTAERKVAELKAQIDRESGIDDARRYYAECTAVSNWGGTYLYGGGHGVRFQYIRAGQGLDCSSSTWVAGRRAGIWGTVTVAPHSSQFGGLPGMVPGPGKYVSIYYNNRHVWTKFKGLGRFSRFDTSPWGWGGRGPRMRMGIRSTSGFQVCHPRGM